MSALDTELLAVAAELDAALKGAVVQKVYVPEPGRCLLEVRVPGRSELLSVCVAGASPRLGIADQRPASPANALGFQQVLRRELTGARLEQVVVEPARVAKLRWSKQGKALTLVAELREEPVLALVGTNARVLGVAGGREGLRVGTVYAPPATPAPSRPRPETSDVPASAASEAGVSRRPPATSTAGAGPQPPPSRLVAAVRDEPMPLARAAERLGTQSETDAGSTLALAALTTRLTRLRRTIKKVQAEAARSELASRYQRDGELLARHLAQVPRGATHVRLTEYLPDGSTEERQVPLDPKRSPKQQMAWLFHQSKRFTRGLQLANQRLAQLKRDELQLLEGVAQPVVRPSKAAPAQRRSSPYREYLGAGGRKILVGRGAAANDTLTFKVALPHHLWLHARGVTGAHVVVPLDKGEAIAQELLLDAAHLALHHSDSKGEARGEVSYTLAKYVRKMKGAPGAVTFTHEKTFWLRVEPDRLARLLAAAHDAP